MDLAQSAPKSSNKSFLARNQFLILRLHSASGLVPVGAYMCVHLFTNASVMAGVTTFQNAVDQIHALGPALWMVEWLFIFLPLIFHAVVGVIIVQTGMSNTANYPYRENIRYTLQRVTAWIALFFIFYHVFHMHGWFHFNWWKTSVAGPLGGGNFDAHHATSSAATALLPIVAKIIYAVGVVSCVYHLANGIWTAGITWGVWTTPRAQRRATKICTVFGVLMTVVGLSAIFGLSRVNIDEAKAVEQAREDMKHDVEVRTEQIRQERKNNNAK